MPNSIKTSMVCLLLLTACATETGDKKKQAGCRADEIVILNENTGQYDCVSDSEYEKILDELDEVRW